ELIPVSTDGELIPSLPDSRIERNPHPRLNIHAYPALYLMQPPDNIVLLRQGGSSFTELIDRMIDVAFAEGWLNEPLFSDTHISTQPWSNSFLEDIAGQITHPALNTVPSSPRD
ncbi:MAG: conjugal transfer protein TraF, partial [Endozoicomonas sp.]